MRRRRAEAFVDKSGATTPMAAGTSRTRRATCFPKAIARRDRSPQCYELTRQLRGTAGGTQVEGARRALQHNLGLGGACVVTMYEKN